MQLTFTVASIIFHSTYALCSVDDQGNPDKTNDISCFVGSSKWWMTNYEPTSFAILA